MFSNNYAGIVPPEVLKLIASLAKRYRVPIDELDDLQQTIIPLLTEFRFDPAIANGATPLTAMTAVIDRQIKAYLRANRRHQKRLERIQNENALKVANGMQSESPDLRLDLEQALLQLSENDRQICKALSQGETVTAIAEQLNCGRDTIMRAIARIRDVFESAGLQAWIDPNHQGNKKASPQGGE
jgi:RNA polymerase sigma factor (sigma-70 family)